MVLGKILPSNGAQITPQGLSDELVPSTLSDALDGMMQQDRALLHALDELEGLRLEIQETNRGVVALYAELEEKAERLREVKAAVVAAAQQWQTTFDAIGDGIALMEPGGKILQCNRAFTELVGKTKNEVEGQDCQDLNYCTPGFIENCLNAAHRNLRRESAEVSIPEGRWLNVTVDPLLDEAGQFYGSVHILTDITERKQYEDRLRFQAHILETINDAVIVLDLSLRITSWNRGAERIYGWKEQEVVGKLSKDVLRSEITGEQRAALVKSLERGEPLITEMVQYSRDGSRLVISGYTIPLRNLQGQITAFVAVNQDVTVRKRTEIELQTYAARLERSNRELQDFANIASHDLQEPLRKVKSFGDLLQAKVGPRLNDQEQDYLERMESAAARMQRMIEDLLAYARVTTQAQPHRPVDLSKVIPEVLSDLEIRIIQSQGKVEVANLPTIEADPLQMRSLFQNLIGNALKFHKKNIPPIVKVESKTLPGNRVEITVTDNGIGFSMEHINSLFQPFRRLHGRSEYEGSGIGLSICRKIVEAHGGSISAQSVPGEGSTFIVILPA